MAEQSPRYSKRLPGDDRALAPLEPEEMDRALTVRITLGEMTLDDAFSMRLPASFRELSLGALIERVFPDDSYAESTASLDVRANPDLPKLYESLLDTFRTWRRGGCDLRFFVNDGPEISAAEPVAKHLGVLRPAQTLLDLVIEQRFTTLDHSVAHGHWTSTKELREWLQSYTMLYLVANSGRPFGLNVEAEPDIGLHTIVSSLEKRRLAEPSPDSRSWQVTPDGRKELEGLGRETESLCERYDVFGDVLYGLHVAIEFESGLGRDLRSDVYEAEGLDPIRTAFLRLLFYGTIEETLGDEPERMLRPDFFDSVLAAAVPHSGLAGASIDSIIESGLTYSEERAEESQRLKEQRDLLARVRKA